MDGRVIFCHPNTVPARKITIDFLVTIFGRLWNQSIHRSSWPTIMEESAAAIKGLLGGRGAFLKFGAFFFLAGGLLFSIDTLEFQASNHQGEFQNGQVAIKTQENNNRTTAGALPLPPSRKNGDAQILSSNRVDDVVVVGGTGEDDDDSDADAAVVVGESPRHTIHLRGKPIIAEDARAEMIQKWGSWTWQDEKDRPSIDFYKEYPNRDVPWTKFPANAWQKDTEYVSRFLQESKDLVMRAMEAILAEYGHGKEEDDDSLSSFEERAVMFRTQLIPDSNFSQTESPITETGGEEGGWSTPRSWEGLKRRLLHSIMTEDTFVFVMGGHSAAAGHGNHFQQAYSAQVQLVLEPVFARLGVKHEARNIANGGLGTVHNGLAAATIYGPDISFLLWDASMIEHGDFAAEEIFARQAILGGIKVPVVWGLEPPVLKMLHGLDVDIGYLGSNSAGLTLVDKFEDLETLPWAARYLKCSNDIDKSFCTPQKYSTACWINRTDFTPTRDQRDNPPGRAGWHPGQFRHKLKGRNIAFTILRALHEVLTTWSEAEGQVLPESAWHVSSDYENTRSKIKALAPNGSLCKKYHDLGLSFFCNFPFKARTEFTPRAYAAHNHMRTLMAPEMLSNLDPVAENVYNPPEVFNPKLHPPDGEIDVVNILESGPPFKSVMAPSYLDFYSEDIKVEASSIPPGKGVKLNTKAADYNCDGVIDSFCNRGQNNNCLLSGQQDGRNGFKFDSFSGWIKFNIPKVKEGYIVLKMEIFHDAGSVGKTDGWTSVNNERRLRISDSRKDEALATSSTSRLLGKKPPPFCEDWQFQFAIDGTIKTLSQGDLFRDYMKRVSRVVDIFPILKDPNYTGGQAKDVEVALRMTGCGQNKVFQLTHVYWA